MREWICKTAAAVFLTVLSGSVCFFASAESAGVSMPSVSMTAYPTAMGGNRLLQSSSAWSSFANPVLGIMSQPKFSGQAACQTFDKNWAMLLGASLKINNKVALCLGGSRLSGDKLEAFDEYGEPSGIIYPSEGQLNLGVGYKINDCLGIGISGKYYMSKYSAASKSTFGADAVLMYDSGIIKAAAGINNIGGKIGGFSLPSSLLAGVAYTFAADKLDVKIGAEADYFLYSAFRAGIDADLCWNRMVSLRGGYSYSTASCHQPSFLTVGLGLNINGVMLDLSYTNAARSFGSAVSAGLGYRF